MTFELPSPIKNLLPCDSSEEEETECQLDKLNIFDPHLSLQLFNLDSVYGLARLVNEDSLSDLEDLSDIYDLIQTIAAGIWSEEDPEVLTKEHDALNALFWLTSIVNDDFNLDCRYYMDEINSDIKLTVEDILAVFINWGATLKTLRVDDLMLESAFEYRPLPDIKHICQDKAIEGTIISRCFSNKTLEIILETISRRLPTDSENWESDSKILLKALVAASLDSVHFGTRACYSSVFGAILDSYSEWNIKKAQELAELLEVGSVDAPFITYTLLLGGLETRCEDLAKCVAYKYIHVTTQAYPTSVSLPVDLPQSVALLESAPAMIERHKYKTLCTMIDLLMILIERYDAECMNNSEKENKVMAIPIKTLHSWSLDARCVLKQDPHKFAMAGNSLYVKANRLTAYTAAMLKNTFFEKIL